MESEKDGRWAILRLLEGNLNDLWVPVVGLAMLAIAVPLLWWSSRDMLLSQFAWYRRRSGVNWYLIRQIDYGATAWSRTPEHDKGWEEIAATETYAEELNSIALSKSRR